MPDHLETARDVIQNLGGPHIRPFMARQIIHDHNISGPQFRQENLLNVGLKSVTVDGTVENKRRDHAAYAQPGHERGRLPMTVGNANSQSLAARRPAVAAK